MQRVCLQLTVLFFLTLPVLAQAATVEKVKGTQAIIVLDEGEEPSPGDKFFAMENGKKKALLEVVRFKNGKAIVKIKKGKATEGMEIAAVGASKAAKSDDDDGGEEATESKSRKGSRSGSVATLFKNMTLGAVFGYTMDTQNVSTGGTSYAMSGTGFSLKGLADIPVMGHLALLARGGAEQFNVQVGSVKTEILYATLDLLLKYGFSDGAFVPFVMGGLGLHFPLSKSSNILDNNRISSTTVFFGGGGINYAMSGTSYIHLTAEYGMFPPSNDVTTSMISLRGGMGFRF